MRRWILLVMVVAAGVGGYCWWTKAPPVVVETPRVEPDRVLPAVKFEGKALDRQQLLAGLALLPAQGFPAGLPWGPLHYVGENKLVTLESLLHHDPILVLEWCHAIYASDVKGYTCTFCKQERVGGKLLPAEKIDVHFCQQPFSVHMHFLEGGGAAEKVLYPYRDDRFKLVARPKGIGRFLTLTKDINGADAKESSRFPVSEFGIDKGTESTIASMQRAQARGALHVRYEGIFKVPELDNRECYKLIRTPYDPVELDGIYEYTLYIDRETMLQTGSILRNREGDLIAQYWFRDVKLNPEFKKDQFTPNSI